MDVPGFARLLKQQNMDSEVWWDAAPTAYESFKQSLILKYPDTFEYIEQLLPDHFALSPSGVCSATTNPRLVAQEVARDPWHWRDFVDKPQAGAIDPGLSVSDRASRLYDQVIREGARQLQPLWVASRGAQGWLSAQVEGGEQMNARALISRGRHLARLAPNVMVKIPGSEQGYRAIEELVAQGCSVNNTFCFTVSQVAACLKAIYEGRLRAQANGVNTDRARYVISFMIGRLGAEPEFERQAQQRRLRLTFVDRRWAELAVYQAIQALLRRWETPARLLLCSLKVDPDMWARGVLAPSAYGGRRDPLHPDARDHRVSRLPPATGTPGRTGHRMGASATPGDESAAGDSLLQSGVLSGGPGAVRVRWPPRVRYCKRLCPGRSGAVAGVR